MKDFGLFDTEVDSVSILSNCPHLEVYKLRSISIVRPFTVEFFFTELGKRINNEILLVR